MNVNGCAEKIKCWNVCINGREKQEMMGELMRGSTTCVLTEVVEA